ncbi:MAG: ROK family protein [Calditrichaeota bacterium]|nr:ROK family protein [Calditrichota bacterium]
MAVTIGIDLGGSRIKGGIIEQDGTLRNSMMAKTRISFGYDALVTQLAELIEQLRFCAKDRLEGIGIGIPGLIDNNSFKVINSQNIDILDGHAVASDLTRKTGLPVVMSNDADCMAIGEGLSGAAKDVKHYIAVTLGTGVGGAIVSNGVLIQGVNGGGGEIGHMSIDMNGPECSCGALGCLEAYIGREGIRHYVKASYPKLVDTSLKKLCEMAIKGNESAANIYWHIGHYLGIGLASLVNIFNPQIIVVGGGIAGAGDLLLKPLENELKLRALNSYAENIEVRAAELGNWAGVVGAGSLAWKNRAS